MFLDSKASKRFWGKVRRSNDCWLWLGGKTKDGYGTFHLQGKTQYAHRVSWVAHNGRMPLPAMNVDHTCVNRACVNPSHLEEVTPNENQRRRRRSVRGFWQGISGTYLDDETGMWQGLVVLGKELFDCGQFPTKSAADTAVRNKKLTMQV